MTEEMHMFAELARAIGIPALFAAVLLWLGMRYIPKFLDAWLESRREMFEQAARSIEAAARCETALTRASEAISKITEVSERVVAALNALARRGQ
ncbi:MAG: hypothetical protein LBS90_00975 [Oscillospiraceae bacterium]|jgi:hypothetical protein|nr:hypothetical protein [Oscillospiraceae bacterium]